MQYTCRFFEISTPDSLLKVSRIPPATTFLTISYVICTIILFVLRAFEYSKLISSDPTIMFDSVYSPILQMVPSEILSHPYSIVLSNLIDVNWWKFVTNVFNLVIGGSFIERNWNSSAELLKFTLIIGSMTNVIVVAITLISSLVIPGVKNNVPLDGNYTVLIGFPIVYKQLFPETTIIQLKNLGFLSKNFRFKLLPIFIMSTLTIGQLIFFHHFAQLLSIWITFFSSWVYLRFFQKLTSTQSNDYMVGDASDTFQLIYLFPDVIKPLLRPIFDWTYDVCCKKLRIIRPFETDDIDKSNTVAEQRGAKKIANPVEERRKQLALQMLQERMV